MNHTNVVDLNASIDTRSFSRFQWTVVLLCFIIIMLGCFDVAVLGLFAPAPIDGWCLPLSGTWPIFGPGTSGGPHGAPDQSKIRFRP
ncbi:hypothetical protein [Klebsiella pneumoniae]|uniref:hypothetical protein n=1 Tax=Klebsiella pneumoniae TaxID=573 RepID=UPI0013E909A5|nr:hypothetical protein [Klebsiella pneumoniae]